MMYKILLADDEITMRNGMQKCIQETGKFKVDVASDGKQALDMLSSQTYDAVILDIMMPEYDGLQVLEQIQDLRPAPVKIIISGYDRFDYAQKALRFGVNDYLIKPLTPDQIRHFLQHLTDVIEKRHEIIQSKIIMEAELENSKAFMRERFLETLVCGRYTNATLQEKLNYYNLSFQYPLFTVAMVSIELTNSAKPFDEKQFQTLELTFLKNLRSSAQKEQLDVFAFHTMGDKIGILFNYENTSDQIQIENLLDNLVQTFREYLNVQLVIGVGCATNSINNLHTSFQEAVMAYRWSTVSESSTVKFYSDLYETSPNSIEGFEIDLLVANLSTDNMEQTIEKLENILSKQRSCDNSFSFNLISQIISACQIVCHSNNTICDKEILSQAYAIMCMDYNRIDGSVLDILKKLIYSTCAVVKKALCEKGNFYVKKAKDLINQYISDNSSEITVAKLANELGLSKNYFGKIFKNSTGTSISTYVTNLRIKKAADLLRTTNMKVYEVAYEVGFENSHYFSVAFKQNIGVTPSEFRDLI